jgi:spore germination cell wall hydrolase CwlJ-like protein
MGNVGQALSDVDILARTLVGEARGEGQAGMEDVAAVIINRSVIASHYVEQHGRTHPLFGDGSAESACLVHQQFSCWNDGDPNKAFIQSIDETSPIFRQAINIAQDAVNGDLRDRTQGATHYLRIGTPAAWAVGHTPCFTEGHHAFYNDIT